MIAWGQKISFKFPAEKEKYRASSCIHEGPDNTAVLHEPRYKLHLVLFCYVKWDQQ